ncbi:hypothetical protein Q8A67_020269 [Cirrhinus molitorella]|uniref:Uncharacterized protein n=1 Tax=Cirrhinus molitorella TaxID=172907 RepID=A0AA88P4Y3_9TELE|nr:hypothetical protein Q8A67_020269 [Cirrhinus molitorella]
MRELWSTSIPLSRTPNAVPLGRLRIRIWQVPVREEFVKIEYMVERGEAKYLGSTWGVKVTPGLCLIRK